MSKSVPKKELITQERRRLSTGAPENEASEFINVFILFLLSNHF